MLNAFEDLNKARIRLCEEVLAGCKPVIFEDKVGQLYLKLDETAYFPYAHGLKTQTGKDACISALMELCIKSDILVSNGFRVSRKPGFVELYPALTNILCPNLIEEQQNKRDSALTKPRL